MKSNYQNLNKDQWLLQYAHNDTSEWGEDGILKKVFEIIEPTNRWCVEFGAWDGKHTSNTYSLMTAGKWSGVFVEADPEKFKALLTTYGSNPRAHCVQRFVNFDGTSTLDCILAQTPIPRDFDLLSIDIDGNDYHIWESLRKYEPRVVVIEFNLTIPQHVEFVQPRDMRVQQGSSALSLRKLGKEKGYELVCLTVCNAVFVKASLFPAFGIADNSTARLRTNQETEYHIFQLYDGTFVVGGQNLIHWQGLPLQQRKFQVFPKMLRFAPDSGGFWRKLMRRIWLRLYLKGLA
jgi:hypothetical protein